MATQRQYEPFTLFNVRITDMRHLWVPSDTYKGKKQERPSYFAGFITPKTQAQWHLEPALAGLTAALGKIFANNPQIVEWKINDGDLPNAEGKSSEFAKGHWLFNASTENPPNVEIVQAGSIVTKLPNKVGVKSGDYCMVGGTAAVSGQNSRAIKLYLNAVVFAAPGEEIVFANSVSGAELMKMAQAQGLKVAGFSASPGGFGGAAPQPQFGGQSAGGFTPPQQGALPRHRAPLPCRLPGASSGAAGRPLGLHSLLTPAVSRPRRSASGSSNKEGGGFRPPLFAMPLHPDDLPADFETRSRCDLKKAGARRYAADPSTGITSVVWQFRGVRKRASPVHPQIGTHTLADLYADVRQCRRFIAHHANFDVSILRAVNPFLELPLSKIDCTMARAQSLALPGGLEQVCTALGMRGKDPRGRELVMKTCRPQRDGTFCEDVQVYRELLEYNDRDVDCLIDLDGRLPPLTPDERTIFERTWRKNEIGLPIDVQLATAIALRRDEIEAESAATLRELTQNAVTKLSQRQRIMEWANSGNRVANLESTQKHIVAEKLADENLHPDVRIVLELLQAEGGSAPLKAQALLDRHINGWYKDATRYFGARSGRGTSEGANMFNVARPSGKYDGQDGRPTIDSVINGLKAGFKYGNLALTDCLRGCIVAPDGYVICDNDESNAEYRIALWMAGDTERLNVLATGENPYIFNAIKMGGWPEGASKKTHLKEYTNYKSCLSADTMVLTRTGWKRIVSVSVRDELWDGERWTTHGGLICQGLQETQDVWGVRATSNHGVFTSLNGPQIPFGLMAQSTSGLKQARLLGDFVFSAACRETTEIEAGGLSRTVRAARVLSRLSGLISKAVRHAVATIAAIDCALPTLKRTILSLMCVPTPQFASGLSTESRLSSTVARIKSQNNTEATEVEASGYGPHGGTTGSYSWHISSRSPATTIQILTWIEKTTNVVTNLGTFVSSRLALTGKTKEPYATSKRRELVYDILDCGPKHRFLISSPQGCCLLVANCTLGGNYQLGWKTYLAHQRRAGNNMDETKARSDIDGYRQANPLLVQLWYDLADAFKMAIYEVPGRIFPAGKIAFQKDNNGTIWMLLPSGAARPHYSAHITYGGEMAFFRAKFGAMLRQKAFGGSLLEIACQSMTRDLITAAEADIEHELPDVHLLLDVYDSILALAPAHVAKERSEQMRSIMKRPRHWTAGLPLDCEGYESERMRK